MFYGIYLIPETKMSQDKICGFVPIKFLGGGTNNSVYEIFIPKVGKRALRVQKDMKDYKFNGIGNVVGLQILSSLKHPNLLYLSTLVSDECETGIAIMTPVYERTLSSAKIDEKSMIPTLFKILCAVNFLHENGYFHLDLKSSNILFSDGEPYIFDYDFSIYVEDVNKSIDNSGKGLQSLLNRAPELFEDKPGNISAAAEVWSLGIIGCDIFNVQNLGWSNFNKDNSKLPDEEKVLANFKGWFKVIYHSLNIMISFPF